MHIFSGWVLWLCSVPTVVMTLWSILAYAALVLDVALFPFNVLVIFHPSNAVSSFFLNAEDLDSGLKVAFLYLVLGMIPLLNILLLAPVVVFCVVSILYAKHLSNHE
jgi:hypothetical protein